MIKDRTWGGCVGQQAAELETPPEGSRAQEGDVKERRETVQDEAGQPIGGTWDRDNREGRMEEHQR